MKVEKVSQNSGATPRLILFFAGWGMDANPFRSLRCEGYDIAVVYDYGDTAPISPAMLDGYSEICVVGWSFGVPYAARFIAREESRRPITRCIAVNGTVYPVDPLRGIHPDIFAATLAALSEASLAKFRRRMMGSREALDAFLQATPSRSIESLADELRAVATDGPAPHALFDAVYISGGDRIIPSEAQQRAWAGHHNIINLSPRAPHWPDIPAILTHEIADKSLIRRSFAAATETYDAAAAVQHAVAHRLAELWTARVEARRQAIEFGVGTGSLTRLLAPRHPLTLIDLAPTMAGVTDADAEIALAPFIAKGGSELGGVISASTIQWFNSPMRFIRRALSLLPSGATLALSSFSPSTYRELAPFQTRRPAYISREAAEALALRLVEEGLSRPDFIIEAPEPTIVTFPSTRSLIEHTRQSGVNATPTLSVATTRALLAAAPTTLTYAPILIILTRV